MIELVFLLGQKDRVWFLEKKENHSVCPLQDKLKKQEKNMRFLFVGDIMLDRSVARVVEKSGFDYIFAKLAGKNFFENYNVVCGNLEGAVTDNGAHYSPEKKYDFAFSLETVNKLKKYNFNFLNLANNHLFDQGQKGVVETRANLARLGFKFSGSPMGVIDKNSASILGVSDKKIAMLGIGANLSLDEEKLEKKIKNLKEITDLIIVNIHWGQEYKHNFNQKQQGLAHRLIDWGADLIIGHHPHVVQGMEIYKNKIIFYSLGNFIFDQYFSADTQEGLMMSFKWNISKKDTFTLWPFKSVKNQLDILAGERKKQFFRKFRKWSNLSEDFAIKDGQFKL